MGIKDAFRRTDANPEVVDASVLEPTQEEQKKEVNKHSEFEQKTGVNPEEIDTRTVVDPNPGHGKSFGERTSEGQPWKAYNDELTSADSKRAEAGRKEVEDITKNSNKQDRTAKN